MKEVRVLTNKETDFNGQLNTALELGWVVVGNITATNVRGVIYYSILIGLPNTKEDETKQEN